MKSLKLISAVGLATMLCSSITSVGNAQQPPGGVGPQSQMGPMNMPQMMPGVTKVGVKGVFTLTGSTLNKLSLITLKKVGSVELLQIPPTTQPSGVGGMGGMPMMMGMQPAKAVMALTAEKTLVVIGNQFFSVDAATMKVVGKATLPMPAPAPGMPGMMPGMQNMPMMPGMMGPGGSMPGDPNQQMPGMMPGMQSDPNQQMPGMMPGMQGDPNQQMPGMQGDPNQQMPGMMPGMQGDPNQQMPGMMSGMEGYPNQLPGMPGGGPQQPMPGMMPGGGPPQQPGMMMPPQQQQREQMTMRMMMMRQGMQMPSSQTTIEVQGTTAYVITGSTVVAVNINNGKITGTNLPAAPKPPVKK